MSEGKISKRRGRSQNTPNASLFFARVALWPCSPPALKVCFSPAVPHRTRKLPPSRARLFPPEKTRLFLFACVFFAPFFARSAAPRAQHDTPSSAAERNRSIYCFLSRAANRRSARPSTLPYFPLRNLNPTPLFLRDSDAALLPRRCFRRFGAFCPPRHRLLVDSLALRVAPTAEFFPFSVLSCPSGDLRRGSAAWRRTISPLRRESTNLGPRRSRELPMRSQRRAKTRHPLRRRHLPQITKCGTSARLPTGVSSSKIRHLGRRPGLIRTRNRGARRFPRSAPTGFARARF
jgi:hypothetical protein